MSINSTPDWSPRAPEEVKLNISSCKDWQDVLEARQKLMDAVCGWMAATARLPGCTASDRDFRDFKMSVSQDIDDLLWKSEVELTQEAMNGSDYYAGEVNRDLANDIYPVDEDRMAIGKHCTEGAYSFARIIENDKQPYTREEKARAVLVIERHADRIGKYDDNTMSARLFNRIRESLKLRDGSLMQLVDRLEEHDRSCAALIGTIGAMSKAINIIGGNA